MPGARTHDRITVITALAADIAYFSLTPKPEPVLAALFTLTYLFAGFACAGDLDLDSREYRRWGPLRFIWWPYRIAVPHRSWVSHGLVFGGLIRAVYLALMSTFVVAAAVWLYSRLGPHVDAIGISRTGWSTIYHFAIGHPRWAGALLSGFILAGAAHTIADTVSTSIKRRF